MDFLKTKIVNFILIFLQQIYQLLLFLDRKLLSNPIVPSCATAISREKRETSFVYENSKVHVEELNDCYVDLKTGLHFFDKSSPILASSSWPSSHLIESRNPLPLFAVELPEYNNTELMVISSSGYYHWLIEDLPSIIHALKEIKNLELICFNRAPSYVREFAELFSTKLVEAPRFVKLKKSLIGVPRPISGLPSRVNVELLAEISRLVPKSQRNFKKIYISRVNSSRSPKFERDLVEMLSHEDWKILYLEKLSLLEQVSHFQNADIIAGVHGAGLSGIVWAKASAKVIEICPRNRNIECFLELARIRNQDIERILVDANELEVPVQIVEVLIKSLN